ncbi:glycosyltransferase family 2 protein [Desulfospira joergensenii]|uniref:glycosyltransferase family 2 protein n=1 Tax=Desulfospira joergensenii TaxID=53329 RepID=UPI0003B6692B|nr:glycosyltransferase family 2 protein [Desulfospira joergensenii]
MISVYIIAFNEQDKIRAAIKSVQWADEIIVADSFSTDKTAKIAESLGARVIQIPFRGFGDLRNRAIEACSNDWIFSLDSDERCTEQVKGEILKIIQAEDSLDAYYIPRKNFFMGKWIRHSGFYPDYRQPQVFRQGVMHFLDDPVHERYEVKSDRPCGYLKNAIHQIPFKSLDEILYKANRYSTLGAKKLAQAGERPGKMKSVGHAVWSFIQHYFLKLGFLDGWPGFIIAFGNFEGTFYKYAKLYEQNCGRTDLDTNPKE